MTLVRTFREKAREKARKLSNVVSRLYMGSVNRMADDGLELIFGCAEDISGEDPLQVLQDTAAARKGPKWSAGPKEGSGLDLLDADAHFAIDAVACHLADELAADVELAGEDVEKENCPAIAAGENMIRRAPWRQDVTPWPEELS